MIFRVIIQFCQAHPMILTSAVLAFIASFFPLVFKATVRVPLAESDLEKMKRSGANEGEIVRAIKMRGLAMDEVVCRRLLASPEFADWTLFQKVLRDPSWRLSEEEYHAFLERKKSEARS